MSEVMPDVDWERVAESLDEFVALRKKELVAVDVTVPSRPAVVVGWRAEALAEIIAAARWGLEAQQRGERAEAALRSEGWELYRPEDCVTVEWCADHQSRWGYNPVCGWSHTGHSCPKRTYRLVPVESEDRQ